jgi:hypothetical protein
MSERFDIVVVWHHHGMPGPLHPFAAIWRADVSAAEAAAERYECGRRFSTDRDVADYRTYVLPHGGDWTMECVRNSYRIYLKETTHVTRES